MKKILIATTICLAFTACTNPKAEEKVALDEVIKVHDKVMGREDQLMHNKMKLDTLFGEAQNDEAKARIKKLTASLAKADAAMSDWMQNFEPAPEGKNHEQLMNYFADQKNRLALSIHFL
ncbi:hypothetical protein [Mucilaginibacter antarcticus]|uniref:hypothetical protein n=1 Tax=Mucilaginibacter antarcticus TaxID=1855725 RepID=UPI003628DAD4